MLKGVCAKDIFNELSAVYGGSAPSYTTVTYWTREVKGGRISVFDEERKGRPQEISVDDELITLIRSERRITVRQLSSQLNAIVGTIQE